jgi:ribonuclease P protein component
VLRRGRRAGRRRLVVHALATPTASAASAPGHLARAGLVVGRGVGPAVTRHRVSRQLRHLLRPRLEALPPGIDLVVRAQPAAAGATSSELGDDLDAALARLGLPEPGLTD